LRVIIMATRSDDGYAAQCWLDREDAERALGKVMATPGRTDEALDRARRAVDKTENKLQQHRDGRAYSG
jgi:hypothetical protein